ncbi:MAG: cation transporter [Acidobacteria bacterium]|nr:cation transporter [Acidobacteriota bacterium]
MPDSAKRATTRRVKIILAVVLVLNVAVAAAKLIVGALIHSISMVADGFHSLTDSASNVVGLIGISYASRPPDEDHPYGHWKFETLSALIIGGLLAMTAWEILRSCFERLHTGTVPDTSTWALVVMGVTMAINLAVSTFERRRGEQLGSHLLTADAAHTRSDVYVSLAVIASLLAARFGFPQADIVIAVVITGAIARAALQIVRGSAGQLTDTAVVPPRTVRELALQVPGVLGVHKVRTRTGAGSNHADLHVQVRADLRLDEAHVIGHMVADKLRGELDLDDIVTHVEPPDGHQTDWRPEGAEPKDEKS